MKVERIITYYSSKGMTRWAVYLIGSPENAKKFSYKLRFALPDEYRSDPLVSSVFRSPCYAVPEDDRVKFVENKYFFIHRSVLEKYCKHGDDLNYGVSVYKNYSYPGVYNNVN